MWDKVAEWVLGSFFGMIFLGFLGILFAIWFPIDPDLLTKIVLSYILFFVAILVLMKILTESEY